MTLSKGYGPFRDGAIETGSGKRACHICGVTPANGHSLRTAGACDFLRRPPAERAAILAENAKREAAKQQEAA